MAHQSQAALIILRRRQVEAQTGLSRSTIYQRISEGLLPSPVSLGPRAVGWVAGEIEALNAARIAGKTSSEIQALVKRLEAARKEVA